jgi:hypothetical protein
VRAMVTEAATLPSQISDSTSQGRRATDLITIDFEKPVGRTLLLLLLELTTRTSVTSDRVRSR